MKLAQVFGGGHLGLMENRGTEGSWVTLMVGLLFLYAHKCLNYYKCLYSIIIFDIPM